VSVVPAILSRRLELASLSPAFLCATLDGRRAEAQALLDGLLPATWSDAATWLFRLRLKQLCLAPETQPWLLRALVERGPRRRVAGYINFHGPPDARGAVEIGYTVLPEFRRLGYAHEAALALFGWARAWHGVSTIIASIAPDNAPSLALAAKLGFVQTGSQIDEVDGLELVFERPV
jgi:[ribosomal protein S5]-alanine N-acetyltransferase